MKNVFFSLIILTGCVTGHLALPKEEGAIHAYFCDQEDCAIRFQALTKDASSVDCAMYNPTNEVAGIALRRGGLIVDGDHAIKGAVVENKKGLMHDKFCIINQSIVWTGSWNPAQGMTIANNVVVLESKTLAKAYESEFGELKSGVFQGGKTGSANVLYNGNVTEAYFCPEDHCTDQILRVLKSAKTSIHVLAYSFTDDNIGKLLEQKRKDGLDVRVVFDPRKDKWSEYERLKGVSKIEKVHHKVFIVDGKTVITGSMNPTGNGNRNNDENVLILREANTAKAFEGEFARVWNETPDK